MAISTATPSPLDDAVHRLQKLSIPGDEQPFSFSFHPSTCSQDASQLDAFAFSPRRYSYDWSPPSSAGTGSSDIAPAETSYRAFVATRSRVVRFSNLPHAPSSLLSAIFRPPGLNHTALPMPTTMWALRSDRVGGEDTIFGVFKTHTEAAAALDFYSSSHLHIHPAIEGDLEPFHKLRRVDLTDQLPPVSPAFSLPPASSVASTLRATHGLRMSSSVSDLHRFSTPAHSQHGLDLPSTAAALSLFRNDYTISSNPPNPRTSFRLGDWICGSPNCAAHNFGRNLSCIGCGCPRPPASMSPTSNANGSSNSYNTNGNFSANASAPLYSTQQRMPSPRFAGLGMGMGMGGGYPPQQQGQQTQQQFASAAVPSPSYLSIPLHTSQPHLASPVHAQSPMKESPVGPRQSAAMGGPRPLSNGSHPMQQSGGTHPLLTPSGRAFSAGGKVQNVSSDPLAPCVMYWPENEAFPEQGQIRPSGMMGVPPPILNTGNRGPIEHQPGDWICLKCNYLNWRRRKVCQTCFPYAEGNGDSISAAVQAERIALLTSVLAQSQSPLTSTGPLIPPQFPHSQPHPLQQQQQQSHPSAQQQQHPHQQRSHSSTPPQLHQRVIGRALPPPPRDVQRSQSHFDLGAQYAEAHPIYQTSGHPRQSSLPLSSLPYHTGNTSAPLLPSFLQDIVQTPAVSPTSTSSADLSFEDDSPVGSGILGSPRRRRMLSEDTGSDSSSSVNLPLGNIWRLDGEESKMLSAGTGMLPVHRDVLGGRKNSHELLRQ